MKFFISILFASLLSVLVFENAYAGSTSDGDKHKLTETQVDNQTSAATDTSRHFHIYHYPQKSIIQIDYTEDDEFEVLIYSMYGTVMHTEVARKSTRIKTGRFGKGTFIVEIHSAKYSASKYFIQQ